MPKLVNREVWVVEEDGTEFSSREDAENHEAFLLLLRELEDSDIYHVSARHAAEFIMSRYTLIRKETNK